MIPEIFKSNRLEDIFKYCNVLNENSVHIPHINYFKSQKKYEKIPVIGSNVAYILYLLALIKKPKNILEIGFGSGFSAISILSALNLVYKNDMFKFTSLEREKKRYQRGKKFIKHFNYNIELLNIDFFEYFNTIKEKKIYFDFIFVDSVKKRYYEIFKMIKDYMISGGIIIFDNVLFNGRVISLRSDQVKKYLNGSKMLNKFNIYVSLDKNFKFFFLPVEDGLAIGFKK